MARTKLIALVGAAFVALPSAGALAADIPDYPPPASFGGGWYLRGHIGMAAQHLGSLDNALFSTAAVLTFLDPGHFDAAPVFGVGVGYQYNDHIRFDLTGEYRGKASFSALDNYDTDGDGVIDGSNEYTAKKSELTFLVNGYYDFASFKGITPYVGAGIGASYNTIYDMRDVNTPNAGVAYGGTASTLSFAWALHAGLAMQVTDNLTLDLGYSYLNLGNAQSGDLIAYDGTNTVYNPMIFNNLTSHDLKLAVRYSFDKQGGGYYPPVVKY